MRHYLDHSIRRTLVLVSLVSLIGIVMAACGTSTTDLAPGDAAPDFTLSSANGQSVSLHDYTDRQQPTLLYFHMALG